MDETLIFCFEPRVGESRRVDPFKVERLLAQNLGGEPLHAVLEKARVPYPNPVSIEAIEKLLAATRTAFDMADVQPDGTGYTEKAQMRVLRTFLAWRDAVKKNIESTPNSVPSTESPSSVNHQMSDTDCGCPSPA
jgi:hypothetical protein